ncbi:MAG TPA: glycosyltransferase family 1 protein [Flavobacteriales bacterium]|nr:glycosyltransferase family 1 protein [Flavobacteriales bacterium]
MPGILVDAYKVKDLNSGLGQFSLQFIKALGTKQHARPIRLLVPKGFSAKLLQPERTIEDSPLLRLFPSAGGRFDLWHSLYQFPSHKPPRGTPWLLTIHDLNFIAEKSGTKADRYLRDMQRDIDRATAVVAISHFTRMQIEERINLRGKAIRVIHNGVALPGNRNAPLPRGIGPWPYFLAIGVLKPKKNIHALLPVLEHFPEHRLVIAGNNATPYGEEVKRAAAALPWHDRIHFLGTVDDDARAALYAHCQALLFPSTAEGFGMPVVEALAMGKPVIARRSTSVPEVGGEHAEYFDDLDAASIARAINRGLARWHGDTAYADAAIRHAATFSWDHCIDAYMRLYDSLLTKR